MAANSDIAFKRLPVKIIGTGSYVPERRLTNADLEKMVDTSHEWIIERTGIVERRIAAPDEYTWAPRMPPPLTFPPPAPASCSP